MSFKIGDAFVEVHADTNGLSGEIRRGMNGLGPDMDRHGGAMGGALMGGMGGRIMSGMGGIALAAGAGAVAGLAGLATAGLVVGIKTAAGLEQAKIGFTTMLGSAEKADSFLKELSSFAAKTPFEFPELQTAAGSLVSVGIETSKIIPLMTGLGNATAGMGTGAEGVNRATTALQQMSTRGKVANEELMQLTEAGIPAYQILADQLGITTGEVQEMASKGQLGTDAMNALMTGISSNTGPMEKFNGLMDSQSQSLGGLWSTFKDTAAMGLAEAVQPLIPLLKDGLGAGIDFIGKVLPPVVTALTAFGTWVGETIPKVQEFFSGLSSGGDSLGGFGEKFGGVVEALMGYWETLFGIFQELWPTIQQIFTDLFTIIQEAMTTISDVVTSITDIIKVVWENFGTYIITFIQGAWEIISGVFSGALQVIQGIFDVFAGIFTGDWSRVWDGIKSILSGVWDAIKAVISGALTIIGAVLGAAWQLISSVASAAWNGIKSLISAVWNGIWGFISGIIGTITGFLSGAWNTISGAVSTAWNAIKTTITTAINNAWDVISGLPGKIMGAFADAGSWLLDAGGDLIRGLWNGITNVKDWILGKIGGFVDSIVGGIKDFFGIGSPSKLMRDEVGKWLPKGMAIGIDANADDVRDAAQAMADGALPTLPKNALSSSFASRRNQAAQGVTRVFNYYAAPGESFTAEDAFFSAASRARMAI